MDIDIMNLFKELKISDQKRQITESIVGEASVPSEMIRRQVASTLHLSYTIDQNATGLNKKIESIKIALSEHKDALKNAAESADKHAAGLKKATIALAIATFFLMIATAGLIFQPIILKWFGIFPN